MMVISKYEVYINMLLYDHAVTNYMKKEHKQYMNYQSQYTGCPKK